MYQTGHMEYFRNPPGTLLDASKIEDWVSMNTVSSDTVKPGADVIYVDDLLMGLRLGFTRPD